MLRYVETFFGVLIASVLVAAPVASALIPALVWTEQGSWQWATLLLVGAVAFGVNTVGGSAVLRCTTSDGALVLGLTALSSVTVTLVVIIDLVVLLGV